MFTAGGGVGSRLFMVQFFVSCLSLQALVQGVDKGTHQFHGFLLLSESGTWLADVRGFNFVSVKVCLRFGGVDDCIRCHVVEHSNHMDPAVHFVRHVAGEVDRQAVFFSGEPAALHGVVRVLRVLTGVHFKSPFVHRCIISQDQINLPPLGGILSIFYYFRGPEIVLFQKIYEAYSLFF